MCEGLFNPKGIQIQLISVGLNNHVKPNLILNTDYSMQPKTHNSEANKYIYIYIHVFIGDFWNIDIPPLNLCFCLSLSLSLSSYLFFSVYISISLCIVLSGSWRVKHRETPSRS